MPDSRRHHPHNPTSPFGHSPSELLLELEVLRGRTAHKIRPVDVPVFLIGSDVDCDLVLGDPQFPEVHCCLRQTGDAVVLRHLGFQPEITVNGQAVTKATLSNGDRVRTGPYEFQINLRHQLVAGSDAPAKIEVQPATSDRVEDVSGSEKVKALLQDIRTELFPARERLRIFEESESHEYGASQGWPARRASS